MQIKLNNQTRSPIKAKIQQVTGYCAPFLFLASIACFTAAVASGSLEQRDRYATFGLNLGFVSIACGAVTFTKEEGED